MSETPVCHRSFALKIWIFSVVVHALLLWALSLIIIPAAEKPASSAVIQSYSYTAVREKPKAVSVTETLPVRQNNSPKPVIQVPKKQPSASSKAAESNLINGSAGSTTKAEPTTNTQQLVTEPSQTKGGRSLAERALASVSAKASEPVVQRQQQRELVVRSGSAAEGELAPAMLKTVKTYADGSELVKGVHGCWKIPPTESRKGATWMMTSTPCETDTTAEQINDILQKRRTYVND